MTQFNQTAVWYRQLASVIPRQLPLKSGVTMLFIGLFFGVYFYLLKNSAFPITVMPLTFIDQWVGFEPRALSLYISLWVYVSLPPLLLATRHELQAYTLAMTGTCLAALLVFYFWPTAVPPASIDWTQYPGVNFLKRMDAAGNAFPSLHVATAIFSSLWLHHLLRGFGVPRWLLVLNWIWAVGIIYSTLATRQHVAVDVAAGLVLGGAAAYLSLRQRAQARAVQNSQEIEIVQT